MEKNPITQSRKKGFTLIELLTVIAIIGILAAIIIPAVGNVRVKAAQAASSSDLKNIATSYNSFAISGARSRTIGDGNWTPGSTVAATSAQWAQVLAEFADLNDGSIYFISSAEDVASIATIPKVVLNTSGDDPTPADDWSGDALGAISYEMAVNIPTNSSASNTPIAWTKGLEADGSWSSDSLLSPWGDDGGHIAFADGHVTFYKSTEDQLLERNGSTSVTDIEDAVGSGNVVKPPSS
jgi:prepilin-type N-terminal cleavage/methylation domain-containing protein/prepilin-type processing-associated H-X9-DG protein